MAAGRAARRQEAAGIDPARLIFIDESGFDTRLVRTHARALGGQRAHGAAPGERWQRLTLIGALGLNGVCAAMSGKPLGLTSGEPLGLTSGEPLGSTTVAAATSTAVFLAFVTRVLIPELLRERPGRTRAWSDRRHRRHGIKRHQEPSRGRH